MTAQIAAEADLERRSALRVSLESLEERLTIWLDEHDDLTATISRLEADLTFFDAASGTEDDPGDGAGNRRPDPSPGEPGLSSMPERGTRWRPLA